jgi:hypothetical protein
MNAINTTIDILRKDDDVECDTTYNSCSELSEEVTDGSNVMVLFVNEALCMLNVGTRFEKIQIICARVPANQNE